MKALITALSAPDSLASHDVSYCIVSSDTLAAGQKIRAWIAAREADGWTVEFSVRQDSDRIGVMWQCIERADGRYQEFSPCISMCGREFQMN